MAITFFGTQRRGGMRVPYTGRSVRNMARETSYAEYTRHPVSRFFVSDVLYEVDITDARLRIGDLIWRL